jgi:hypothetical protein|tara:strand:- start:35 stop:598 length:564 start_codon:yes stop_codon:yes gene_type:complete
MTLLSFCEWLAETEWSIALHESFYMYPLIESTHVVALFLFAGTIAMVDLRLLGFAFRDVPVSEINARILPWTVAGAFVMVLTGVLLFYAIPVRTYQSLWFRFKVVFLLVAAFNVWRFHRRVQKNRVVWDSDERPPRSARVSGAVSLSMWAGVIVFGRMIAYNWFDCDRPQSDFVYWLSGCIVELADA